MSNGRVLVVTGAGRGIGAAVARLAAREGYAVCVNYRTRKDDAMSVVHAISRDGGSAFPVQADVTREDDVRRLFAECDATLGRVTALVNNAAIVGAESRIDDVEATSLDMLWTANITSSVLCAREAIRRMSTCRGGAGGTIVNVSSMVGKLGGGERRVAYGASKGAINAFTIGLAREVAGEGIRVTAVAPGLIDTPIHDAHGGAERITRLAAAIPLRRAGTPDEVAHAILWLLSPLASYVTGTILEVGGGK